MTDPKKAVTDQTIERLEQAAQEPQRSSPTAGMNIVQRILHVGGRNNAAGYVEFGSIDAVNALVCHVLRDLPLKREWQGLTDADIKEFLPSAYRKPPVKIPPGWEQMIHGLEARLKEKNK